MMVCSITAQRVTMEDLIHLIIHHDARGRRECACLLEGPYHGIGACKGNVCTLAGPERGSEPLQFCVQAPGIAQSLIRKRIKLRDRVFAAGRRMSFNVGDESHESTLPWHWDGLDD